MKYAHTMIRVSNLDKSLLFYTEALGFKMLRKSDYAEDKFTLVFLRAHGDSEDGPSLELTYNWGVDHYDRGTGYGHMAYSVKSIDQIKQRLVACGFDLSWGPGKEIGRA